MGSLHQGRGKSPVVARSFSSATTLSHAAKKTEDSMAFEPLHDVSQRPQFSGLSSEWAAASQVPIQAKMQVGEVGDRYEQEADRLAPEIVRQINAPGFGEPAQSATQEDAALNLAQPLRPTLQLKGAGGGVSPAIESAIASARGGGQPLEPKLQARIGQAMAVDLSRVRVHTDARADALNRALNSSAFTTQQDVFFRKGEYSPGTSEGQMLIAHELTHVVHQSAPTNGVMNVQCDKDKKNRRKKALKAATGAFVKDVGLSAASGVVTGALIGGIGGTAVLPAVGTVAGAGLGAAAGGVVGAVGGGVSGLVSGYKAYKDSIKSQEEEAAAAQSATTVEEKFNLLGNRVTAVDTKIGTEVKKVDDKVTAVDTKIGTEVKKVDDWAKEINPKVQALETAKVTLQAQVLALETAMENVARWPNVEE
jgi:outer membrane lipoprotein SlyB